MKIRLITGTCYIAVLLVFFLKIFVARPVFRRAHLCVCPIGTFEMTRAMKDGITKAENRRIRVCRRLYPRLRAVRAALGLQARAVCFFALAVALCPCWWRARGNLAAKSRRRLLRGVSHPPFSASHLDQSSVGSARLEQFALNSDLAILFVFVISPFADSLAYVFGRFLKSKFPKKMAPVVSPNKTVIGGVGGLVGGLVGAAILYFSYNAVAGSFADMAIWLPVYLLIGLLAAAATEFGDLVESCIKRKAEIKDMGRLMPGHGGILDRIDGTQFAAVAVYVAFAVIHLIA
ncbi:MAG: phosphatidate cytidylyltransferase [Christensenellaceae bacterium]